jgi:hypothetical protein
MDTGMKKNRPWSSSVCLCLDHPRRSEAEVAEIMAYKERKKPDHIGKVISTNITYSERYDKSISPIQ